MKTRLTPMILMLGACGGDTGGAFHSHEGLGPHLGETATFAGAGATGHLELKLHDDKGDLELWLFEDARFERPFDLPLDAAIEIEFLDVERREVTLRPRDTATNADEDGVANIRAGKTNYFIFPSRDGEDASWLKGPKFTSNVVVRFARDGKSVVSSKFVAKPHVH